MYISDSSHSLHKTFSFIYHKSGSVIIYFIIAITINLFITSELNMSNTGH